MLWCWCNLKAILNDFLGGGYSKKRIVLLMGNSVLFAFDGAYIADERSATAEAFLSSNVSNKTYNLA